jgi:hypothetical protein
MHRPLIVFVEQPCQHTFLAARDAVLRQSLLPIMACDLAALDRLLDQKEYQTVLDQIDALPPSKVLSPRVHFLAAEAAEALGDAASAELERSLFILTIQGLLATGDGTPQHPYIVCHPTDEYDIAAALGLETAGQSLVEQNGQLCDVLVCTSGRELWFDVTDILIHPRRRKATKRRKKAARRRRVSRVPR